MTKRPSPLLQRPVDDALSDVLRCVRFTRAIYYTVTTLGPWPPIRVPLGSSLARAFGARTQQVLSYHVMTQGDCWTGLDGEAPVRLDCGDIVVYPRGDDYYLSPAAASAIPSPDAAGLVGLLQGVSAGAIPPAISVGGGAAASTQFVCGFLGCDPRPFDPLLAALPKKLVVRGADERLAHLVKLALAEVAAPGADSVRERLSESMFIETVRQHLATLPPHETGWLAGLRDPVVGRALALLHEGPAEPWTLSSLAKQVGASRSSLADRFTKLVGEPPMHYLTRWRMGMAAHLLRASDAKVAAVATEVGYDSEAAFSRAFKKAAGATPAAYRSGTQTTVQGLASRPRRGTIRP